MVSFFLLINLLYFPKTFFDKPFIINISFIFSLFIIKRYNSFTSSIFFVKYILLRMVFKSNYLAIIGNYIN